MTENEAKGMLQAKLTCMELELLSSIEKGCDNDCDACVYCYAQGTVGEHKKALEMAIKALSEIQQYRAIGTVEELQKLKGVITDFPLDCGSPIKSIAEIWNQLKKYLAIGTIEYFRDLKEKNEPKKPDKDEFDRFTCPDCGWIVSTEEYGGRFLPHCENCGQAIDWSE